MPVSAPVAGGHIAETQPDDKQHDRHLDDNDGGVKARAFLDADSQYCSDDQGDDESRHIPADFHAEHPGRIEQVVRALQQLRRLGGDDVSYAVQEGLGTGDESRSEACAICRATMFSAARSPVQ